MTIAPNTCSCKCHREVGDFHVFLCCKQARVDEGVSIDTPKTEDQKSDVIRVYIDMEAPKSSRFKWTRKTSTNHRIVGSSTEGYSRLKGALDNIDRTQKEPYTFVFDDGLPEE